MFSSLQMLEDKILLASHPSIAARKCHQDTESSPRVLDKSYAAAFRPVRNDRGTYYDCSQRTIERATHLYGHHSG